MMYFKNMLRSMSLKIKLFGHHHHLALKCSQRPFQCDGCKELGFGACYQCEHQNCRYILHDACAEASETTFHPFFKDVTFKFYSKPSDASARCDACGNNMHGFHYHAQVLKDPDIFILSSVDFHPVCLKLKYVLQSDDGSLTLYLRDKVSYSRYNLSSILNKKCQHCKSTELFSWLKGWAYVSSDGNYRYHVACIRDMMYDKWKTSYFKGNMTGYIANGSSSSGTVSPLNVVPSNSQTAIVQHSDGASSLYLRMAKVAISLIISAIFGEPTGILHAAVEIFGKN